MTPPNGHADESSGRRTSDSQQFPPASIETATGFTRDQMTAIIAELEVPFEPVVIEWRVTNTAQNKSRGQVIPYADQRAYTDRLNRLLTPGGWTRKYEVHTSPNFQRSKDQRLVAKILVTCELTIFGIGSHSATGEEWADDENAGTAAEAQAFKRACCCFGLGRYLYYFSGIWVDLDGHKRPKKFPQLPLWATPNGWLRGLRPQTENPGPDSSAARNPNQRPQSGGPSGLSAANLVAEIEAMAHPLGRALYRGILKSVARVWNPAGIDDPALQQRVLEHMQAAERGLDRLKVGVEKASSEALARILSSLGIRSLEHVDNLEALKQIVLSLETLEPRR